ncbi:hypothetical protein [Raineyella sp. W15-4]|uniref:hypothetical protein n=1 Tax=Raineyella sp. W15-4 TaxID=3081651 RepID=UPI0029544DC3|nr:hypothetical protein [Raineyella sp. W15-4]WOQ18725.1 hypothetical protein R0145_08680 [Raineyella sp. W15-4]
MRLPLQNLWAGSTLPGRMPIALLPFSQYAITLLWGLIVTGYALAGVLVRLVGGGRRSTAAAATGGTAAVYTVAMVQTVVVVALGLQHNRLSWLYLVLMLAVIIAADLAGVVVLQLIAVGPAPAAVVGLSLAAVALRWWLLDVALPLPPVDAPLDLRHWPWLPTAVSGLIVGASIAWSGVATRTRATAALGSLAVLWIVPAAFSGIQTAAGYRVYLRYPAELARIAAQTFVRTLIQDPHTLIALAVAVAVALVGLAMQRLRRRAWSH